MNQSFLYCNLCGKEYDVNSEIWQCTCGGLLDLDFTPVFDKNLIKMRKPNLWRYREAIPVQDDSNIISFQEGFTPLISIEIDNESILVKQDHLFPTGSYKDRGASVLVSKAREIGVYHVVEDSSGNAGAAIAAYCAFANISSDIYVPQSTSPEKLRQIESYGSRLFKIPGNREDTAYAVMQAARSSYYASHSWNPFFFHGTKTFAYEIWEQLNWGIPDQIIIPVGNGTLLLGAWIGFKDLLRAGMIDRLPKLIAVQSINCAPLAIAFEKSHNHPAQIDSLPTIAEGIAIAEPVRGSQIIKAVKETDGRFVTVNDQEILQALDLLNHKGFYIEPTSAVSIAAFEKIRHLKNKNEIWVTVFTGHGLKSSGKK